MNADRIEDRDGGDTTLLDQILAAFEKGEEIDREALKASHPERASKIELLIAASRRYFASVRSLAGGGAPDGLLRPGDRLGDFEIVQLLGRGGEGEVYRARQGSLGGRAVALKVLSPDARNALARGRFEREAMLLADLHHPHLAEVHGFGEERGLLFLAMRLVEGVSLRRVQDLLREAPAPPDRETRRAIVGWIADVCEALALVHGRGLVHRDVKPSNVLVQQSDGWSEGLPHGEAVLVDFGLARRVAGPEVTRTGHRAATPEYAAPEQLLGAEVDSRADVFALGATLHDLLTGRLPAHRPQASAGLEPLEEILDDVDRDLFAVVRKAVEIDPRRRYADAGAVLRDLRAWESGGEVSARRQNAAERVLRWVRAHPRRLGKAASLAACALVLASALQRYGRYAGFAADAREAYARADLVRFSHAAAASPRFLLPLLVREDGVRRYLDRIATENPEDSRGFREAVRCLEQDDFEGAIDAAATEMRLRGPSADPLLERFLLEAVRGAPRSPGGAPLPGRRSAAIRILARLFYERPPGDPPDLDALAPWRQAVLEIFRDPASLREDRFFALTALSGCAQPEDAAWMLDWALGEPNTSEECRLGLACAERVLRRAHRFGHLARVDLEGMRDRLDELVLDIWNERWTWERVSSGTQLGIGFAIENLASEIALAMRTQGRPVPWRERIPESVDRIAAEDGCVFPPGGRGHLYVIGRLETLVERMQTERPWRGVLTLPLWVGLVCGLVGDASLLDLARERIRDPRQCFIIEPPKDLEALFEEGRSLGIALARGENPPFLPDEDTLLGSIPDPSIQERDLCPLVEGAGASTPLPLATWDFTANPPVQTGAARGAVIHLGDLRTGDNGYRFLRMGRFGESELRLLFEVTNEHAHKQWLVRLEHLAGLRPYYPSSGEIFLELRLDEKTIDAKHRISGSDARGRFWFLPSELVTPGQHALTVRLDATTTTTYRVEGVTIRLAD